MVVETAKSRSHLVGRFLENEGTEGGLSGKEAAVARVGVEEISSQHASPYLTRFRQSKTVLLEWLLTWLQLWLVVVVVVLSH